MNNSTVVNIVKTLSIISVIATVILLLWWTITTTLFEFAQTFNINNSIKTSSQNEVENMRKEIRESDKYLKAFSQLTITETDVPGLLDIIENSFESKIMIKDVIDNKGEGVLYVSIKFTCGLFECIDVAEQIVETKPTIGVKALTLTASEEREDIWTTNMTISLPLNQQDPL